MDMQNKDSNKVSIFSFRDMPIKVKVGFWATFISAILDKLLGVLPMKGIVLPPVALDILFYGLLILLVFGLVMLALGLIEWAKKTQSQKQTIENQSDNITNLEHSLELLRSEYNQRKIKLHQSLDELYFDVKSKRVTEIEYQTTEYQTRIKDCRELASNTGNPMVVGRTSGILNLIYLYLQRVQQARKEDNADFHIETIDSTFSTEINTQLGLLLSEVQNE